MIDVVLVSTVIAFILLIQAPLEMRGDFVEQRVPSDLYKLLTEIELKGKWRC